MYKHDVASQTVDSPQELLFVGWKRSRSGPYSVSYRGYSSSLLCDQLSEREQQLVLCNVCHGIMLGSSISVDNKILCSFCVPTHSNATPLARFTETICTFCARCPLTVRGFDWIGTLAAIQSHVEKCDYLFTVCTLGCSELMLQKLMVEHTKNSCVMRYISCELCLLSVRVQKLPEHLGICPKFIVSCEECGEALKRCCLDTHQINVCKYRPVKCTYSKYGCRGKMRFCDLSQHMNDTKDVHLKLLETAVAILEEKNIRIEKDNRILTQLSDPYPISVQLQFEQSSISRLKFGFMTFMDLGTNITFQDKTLKLIITQESNNRLYFALVFPSPCIGTCSTILVNQDNPQESILFKTAEIVCPLLGYYQSHSMVPSKKSILYSLISTGLEGLSQPPYLQGGWFKLKLMLSIYFTESDK